jgi:hypothetical protein
MIRRQAFLVLGFLGSFIVLLLPNLVRVVEHDEGFIVTGAMMILDGQLPYRDFLSYYGPAQYYVLAALFRLFGENLIVSRLEHVLCMAAFVPVIVIASTNPKHEPGPTSWIIAGVFLASALISFPNANYPAIPATLLLLIACCFLKRWIVISDFRDASIASICIGVAGLFRWDFGVFGLFAANAAIVIIGIASRTSYKTVLRSLVIVTAPATAMILVIYLPLLMTGDPVRWYQEILHYSLFDAAKYRGIAFVRPAYWKLLGAIRAGNVLELYESLFRLLYIATPVALVALTLPFVVYRARHNSSGIESFGLLLPPTFLALLCGALLNQMRVRPTLWQGFPALVISLPLLTYLLQAKGSAIFRKHPRVKLFTSGVAFLVFAALATLSLSSLLVSMSNQVAPLGLPRASAIKVLPGDLGYARVIREVAQRMDRGDFIYSGPSDHSRLFVNDSLLYFLVDGRPATRFVEMEPGIANTVSAQQEICDALLRKKVRVVALLDAQSHEPNLSSRSNGIHIVDDCIRYNFDFIKTVGSYSIFVSR